MSLDAENTTPPNPCVADARPTPRLPSPWNPVVCALARFWFGSGAVLLKLNPVVVFGNDEQKQRMLPPLIAGKDKACFAVTEPNVGLDTLKQRLR